MPMANLRLVDSEKTISNLEKLQKPKYTLQKIMNCLQIAYLQSFFHLHAFKFCLHFFPYIHYLKIFKWQLLS